MRFDGVALCSILFKYINAIKNGSVPISPELYSHYADNLRRAVDAVPALSPDLAAQFHANVSRFAAYKAYKATTDIRTALGDDPQAARATLRRYNTWQAAEYNTAVHRARTAEQWERFSSEKNVRLFPNLRWIPSRSATPREAHRRFWNRIWAKDDPFWNENTPGTLWNCKCDWEQTNRPVTDGNPTTTVTAKGLSGNPAKTGEIFTSTPPEPGHRDLRHPYFANAPEDKVEPIALNLTRKSCLQWAKDNLQGKTTTPPSFGKKIAFTGKGIRDYLNQPIDEPILKAEMIRFMPALLDIASYLGYSDFKASDSIRHSHIFELHIAGKTLWLIVREYTNNDISFYSITNKADVLIGLIYKENTRPLE